MLRRCITGEDILRRHAFDCSWWAGAKSPAHIKASLFQLRGAPMTDTPQIKAKRWNVRIPARLEKEDADLPKRLRKPRYSHFEKLPAIYEMLDRYNALANGLTACSKGCAFCCHMEIGVLQIEADFISAKIGIPSKQLSYDPTKKSETFCDPSRPCPFLDRDFSCAIYPIRPMVCRTHVSFEATDEPCRFESETQVILLVDRAKSFPGAMKAYGELANQSGGSGGDIREFFGRASLAVQAGMAMGDEKPSC